ncbi:MAG TPA: ATP-dependent DNA helicase [Polyangiaceae bacterium]
MAEAVARALAEESILFCEAGTGTGKTLAYLLPAILSGKKVVISTATRALQEQIVSKDLPLLERAFGLRPRVRVMKGISNYLCLRRFDEFRKSPESLRPRHARALASLESFARESTTGDIAELAALPEHEPIWREVIASSDTRIGANCAHYRECFVTRMKREAAAADVLIVNHHLFFADLALRGPHPGRALPDYDAVVFDEAHQLEDIAGDFFGLRVSEARLMRVLRDAERAAAACGFGEALFSGGSVQNLASEIELAARALFAELAARRGAQDGRWSVERDAWIGRPMECWYRLDNALDVHAAYFDGLCGQAKGEKAREVLELVVRRVQGLREQFSAIIDGGGGRVTWFESTPSGSVLSSSQVDLSAVLRERVFETIPSVVLTSATLTNSVHRPGTPGSEQKGAFEFLRQRLGADGDGLNACELVVESPFDFESRALFYTPRDLPSPSAREFADAAAERIAELVRITGGGAFVLTTSVRSMRLLHAKLRQRLGGEALFLQGEMPKAALVSSFRAAGDAVLVATSSFWEGVDVPGRALRLVVLEKIPFPVPSDPIVQARSLALDREGRNSFMEYHVPSAALTLKQGFGRLIRSSSDAGIVALLDERVHRRGYARRLLSSLPKTQRAFELGEVERFWQAFAGDAPETAPAEHGA